MARKITVKFNGKAIGTRTTDRRYTHALVLTDFDPAVLRAAADQHHPVHVADDRADHRHATIAQHKDYKYASVTSDEERARYAEVAATPFEEYSAQRSVGRQQRLEEHIARCISRGAQVLSYHQSRDLAFKAQAAASKTRPEYLVLVEPVEA